MTSVRLLSWAVLAASLLHSVPLQASESLLVRSATNGRIWQVNLAPSEPIRWAWTTGSDTAKLMISNLMAKTSSEVIVTRVDEAIFGSYALTVPDSSLEQVFTLAIEQYYHYGQDTQRTVDTARARIAYLPGIHGNVIDVAKARTKFAGARAQVFSYDASWASGSASATNATLTATPVAGAASVRTLEGTSGYDVATCEKEARLDLAFDDIVYWTKSVRFGRQGLLIMVR